MTDTTEDTQPATETPAVAPTEVAAEAAPELAPETSPEAAADTPDVSMGDHAAYEESFRELKPGQLLSGKVIRIDAEGVLVDVGYKTEGFIPLRELTHRKDVTPEEILKVGEELDVSVVRVEGNEGGLILSKRRADLEGAWIRVLKAQETKETLTATCTEQVKGGLIVDLGLRGFVPASHVDLRPVHDLSDYVGESLELKVLEIDKARRKVVLSRKLALDEERSKMKERTMVDLEEGQILSGTVARLTNFGAFINLGGVDGLVHISELSWKRVKHPNEVVRVGEKVDVRVLGVNLEKERISLSLKQARPDPWTVALESIRLNQILPGRITKLAKNYLFVEIADGVEGLVPLSELSNERVQRPQDLFRPDQEVKVKVLEIKSEQRRILLSIRQGSDDYEAPSQGGNRGGGNNDGGFTIGDRLQGQLAHLLQAQAPEKAQEKPVKAQEKASEKTQEKAPEVVAEKAPEVAPEATPEVAAEAAPEVVAEKAPEVAAEAAPEVAEEKAPEATAG